MALAQVCDFCGAVQVLKHGEKVPNGWGKVKIDVTGGAIVSAWEICHSCVENIEQNIETIAEIMGKKT